jgi:PPOX class probable F420-dependent enzyme
MSDQWVADVLASARVGRLGTIDHNGAVRLVPFCFAVAGDWIVSAVDHKPKRNERLARLDDIASRGIATVLVDHYEEDWTQLWWVRVRGRATVHVDAGSPEVRDAVEALAAKYGQYRDRPPTGAVYRVALDDVTWWQATPRA